MPNLSWNAKLTTCIVLAGPAIGLSAKNMFGMPPVMGVGAGYSMGVSLQNAIYRLGGLMEGGPRAGLTPQKAIPAAMSIAFLMMMFQSGPEFVKEISTQPSWKDTNIYGYVSIGIVLGVTHQFVTDWFFPPDDQPAGPGR